MNKPSESPWIGLEKSKNVELEDKIKKLTKDEQPRTKPNQTNKNSNNENPQNKQMAELSGVGQRASRKT